MRRILLSLLCLAGINCVFAQKDCRQLEYNQKLVAENPSLQKRFKDVEDFTQNHLHTISSRTTSEAGKLPDVITIPVVVHVVYYNNADNISKAQIQSQIDALNKDFRKTNNDNSKVPSYFSGFAADCGFEFKLANIDPAGNATTGIVRKKTGIQYFTYDDKVKFSSLGGDDAWDATQYLNIWVASLAGGIVGYSSLPGCAPQNDGVVIRTNAFGIIGSLANPFTKGRTATHEIGHWLNLRHIWGDTYCGDDLVHDTPKQRSASSGCPSGKKYTCETTGDGDMYMNYMDLTDDACMVMFTQGQKERMRALFASGGVRAGMLTSKGLSGKDIEEEPETPTETAIGKLFSVYPNPAATTTITLKANASVNCAGKTLTVYNQVGQPVLTQAMNNNLTTINIGTLKAGIYFIKTGDASGSMIRFVKI